MWTTAASLQAAERAFALMFARSRAWRIRSAVASTTLLMLYAIRELVTNAAEGDTDSPAGQRRSTAVVIALRCGCARAAAEWRRRIAGASHRQCTLQA
jgi:hypothetical protein